MPIYEVGDEGFVRLETTTFAKAGIRERKDLQRFLREQIEIIAPDTLVISEEFGDWEESKRRVDLLGIDKSANLVVIELKRTEDGGHMELQAIRYAAMVSAITFEEAVNIYGRYLASQDKEDDPREQLLEFLNWDEPDEDLFAQEVVIVLASAEFSKEITSSVLWLNTHGLDIRCVRLRAYREGVKVLVDVQQIIPLPEAAEYQIRVRDKARLERVARSQSRDLTKYDVTIGEQTLTRLPKRQAILSIIRYLCAQGVDPEAIRAQITWRNYALVKVPGILDSHSFEQALENQFIEAGKKPQTKRFFLRDDELIHANGSTYAVTKMWGVKTEQAMNNLVQEFKNAGASFRESV